MLHDLRSYAVFARRDLDDAALARWLDKGAIDTLPYSRERVTKSLHDLHARVTPKGAPGAYDDVSDHHLRGALIGLLWLATRTTPLPGKRADRSDATNAEATDEDRELARATLIRGDNETEEQYERRVDYLARHMATARVLETSPGPVAPPREREAEGDRADQSWRQTLRDGAAEKVGRGR